MDEPRSAVSAWVKSSDHDKLIKLARRLDTSVSQVVARLIKSAFR
ncbi:MAG TPA: hypothetical protein VKE96_17470 [Vicinamibacterales bacterium]|nr:hypothetical protein [Vicinamibacterales bacterium]